MSVAQRVLAAIVAVVAIVFVAAAQQLPDKKQFPDGVPVGPSAKILSFTAKPSSIEPGQIVTLEWAAVNADRITLDPGVGIVATRGSLKVSPSATTTYTLSALGYPGTGNDKESVTVKVAGTSPTKTSAPPTSETIASMPVPRTPDGKPDLSGIWIAPYMSVKPIDNITLKPGTEKYKVGPEYGFGLTEHCLLPGLPEVMSWPYPLQIVQTPSQVVILYEGDRIFRVIPTDGRGHPPDLDPTWMGNSIGHWEGDTLVVDVTGFNDKTAMGDYRHTAALHVVERYQRPAFATLQYEATVDDPNVFAAPWREAGTLTLHPEWYIQEYSCEENNHDYKALFEQYKK